MRDNLISGEENHFGMEQDYLNNVDVEISDEDEERRI